LNPVAEGIREKSPDLYQAIRARCVGEWGTDHAMVVYTINQQCEAFLNVCTISQKAGDSLFYGLLVKWCDDDITQYDSILIAPIDWTMVEYELIQQLEAKAQY